MRGGLSHVYSLLTTGLRGHIWRHHVVHTHTRTRTAIDRSNVNSDDMTNVTNARERDEEGRGCLIPDNEVPTKKPTSHPSHLNGPNALLPYWCGEPLPPPPL